MPSMRFDDSVDSTWACVRSVFSGSEYLAKKEVLAPAGFPQPVDGCQVGSAEAQSGQVGRLKGRHNASGMR